MFEIDSPISLANTEKNINFQHSAHGGYYTAVRYDVIHDIFCFVYICESWGDLV